MGEIVGGQPHRWTWALLILQLGTVSCNAFTSSPGAGTADLSAGWTGVVVCVGPHCRRFGGSRPVLGEALGNGVRPRAHANHDAPGRAAPAKTNPKNAVVPVDFPWRRRVLQKQKEADPIAAVFNVHAGGDGPRTAKELADAIMQAYTGSPPSSSPSSLVQDDDFLDMILAAVFPSSKKTEALRAAPREWSPARKALFAAVARSHAPHRMH